MSEKTYVRHVKTGEVFELHLEFPDVSHVFDGNGERRVFKREMLTPYDPEEPLSLIPRLRMAVSDGDKSKVYELLGKLEAIMRGKP